MQKLGVGGPSVFVLLSLVNKETALGLLIGQNLGKQGRQNLMLEERRVESEIRHGSARDRCWEFYPVSHCHVAIHRLIEMG